MPLYQAILITRPGPADKTVVAIRNILTQMFAAYPHMKVRDVSNLGDRIMGKPLKKMEALHHVGRYIQIIYDAPPRAHYELQHSFTNVVTEAEIFRAYSHRMKDMDYLKQLYFKAGRLSDMHVTDDQFKDYDFAMRIQRLKDRFEKVPPKPEKSN